MAVRIITDSTSDMTQEEAGKKDLLVVPLHNYFGEEDFLDGVTISKEQFFERLATAQDLPKSSQPSPDEFLSYFNDCKEAADSAVVITIASQLSGTYQSAMIAKEMCEYEQIYIVDSETTTLGLLCLVEYALELRNQGMAAEQIADELNQVKNKIQIYALVDTLKYLKMGGRLSATAALAGTLLHIKPIIEVTEGVVTVAAKTRGLNGAYKKLIDLIVESGGIDESKPMAIGYTGDASVLEPFRQFAQNSLPISDAKVSAIGSTIGVHAGPGACGIGYFRK